MSLSTLNELATLNKNCKYAIISVIKRPVLSDLKNKFTKSETETETESRFHNICCITECGSRTPGTLQYDDISHTL